MVFDTHLLTEAYASRLDAVRAAAQRSLELLNSVLSLKANVGQFRQPSFWMSPYLYSFLYSLSYQSLPGQSSFIEDQPRTMWRSNPRSNIMS